jgi:Tol biopolymer transport system component
LQAQARRASSRLLSSSRIEVGNRRSFLAAVTLAVLFAAAACPDSARATFPGENGRFLLTWDRQVSGGVSTSDLLAVSRGGHRLHAIAHARGYRCGYHSGDWSPSGRRVVYLATCDGVGDKLVITRPDGSNKRVVYRGEFLSSPAWSPYGRRIAFVAWRWSNRVGDYVSDIYIIRRDGTGLTRLTRTTWESEAELDWSSRNLLVFRSSRRRFWGSRYELFTMRPNGQALRRLTNNDLQDRQPDWAPGGRRLTFIRRGPDNAEIWKMDASGENASMVASVASSPVWAPDGSLIAFLRDRAIYTVRPSGRDETLIGSPVQRGSIGGLDWQPR